jgi:hypothetical protein
MFLLTHIYDLHFILLHVSIRFLIYNYIFYLMSKNILITSIKKNYSTRIKARQIEKLNTYLFIY